MIALKYIFQNTIFEVLSDKITGKFKSYCWTVTTNNLFKVAHKNIMIILCWQNVLHASGLNTILSFGKKTFVCNKRWLLWWNDFKFCSIHVIIYVIHQCTFLQCFHKGCHLIISNANLLPWPMYHMSEKTMQNFYCNISQPSFLYTSNV